MARSIFCSKCRIEKEPGRENQSYCKECRRKHLEERKKEVKVVEFKPRRPRRNSEAAKRCPDCNILKENPKQTYCNACRRMRNNVWTLETGRVRKHQTGLCPCGAERAPNQSYFCRECKAEESRQWRAVHRTPDEVRQREKLERDEYQRFKMSVRKITQYYVKTGVLVKQPCETCMTEEKVDAHHDDYNKPMEVRWLCRKHHLEYHRNQNLIKEI